MTHDHGSGAELAVLIDEKRLDDLLARVSLTEVAQAWHCYHRRDARSVEDPDWWAVEFWMDLGFVREDTAREGLLALIDASDEEHLGYVGAGPLEVFVCEDEGRMSWIERTAPGSPGLQVALRNVYCWGAMEDRYCERLERVAGGPLPRPRWPHRGSRRHSPEEGDEERN